MLNINHSVDIANHFALGDRAVLSGPTARGELGQVWRLSTMRGMWAVKELFERQSESDASEFADYQDAAHGAGVPVPTVVRANDGTVLLDVGSAQVRVYEWVDINEPDVYLDPAAVGKLVATIHLVDFPGRIPVDEWYTDPVGAERWDALFRSLAEANAPFVRKLLDFRDELIAMEGLIEPPQNLQTCHRDLWADNVRSTPSGGLCVIDWENAGLAEPTKELCAVLSEFGFEDAARARALWRAYVDAGGPGRVSRRADFSMAIAQIGHIGEVSCRTWLEAETQAERDRAAGRVAEFIERPITLAIIDELLDAVTQ